MLDLVEGAGVVVTDSGGLQEETTALGVPCLTIRENTERPITVTEGTNRLVPNPAELYEATLAAKRPASAKRPEGWDGHAAERVVQALEQHAVRTQSVPLEGVPAK
jgi:UDP-N-acetylglucosamine 2-epimerase (non-hydrolysing)